MNAGRLDRTIRIEQAPVTYSPRGEEKKGEWALLREVAAEVLQPGGREFFAADQTVAKGRAVFRIRYPAGLLVLPHPDDTMRIIYEGRAYDIQDVREIGRREGLEIHAEARSEAA